MITSPTDPSGTATHVNYIAHHNGPQYFGYEANNPDETQAHLKGLGDFFTAINANALPNTTNGGVFYVRGGYGNLDGLIPRSPSPAVKAAFRAMTIIQATPTRRSAKPFWPTRSTRSPAANIGAESAIIITYDETDGLYDHTQPQIRSFDPLGNALDQGPRIPDDRDLAL